MKKIYFILICLFTFTTASRAQSLVYFENFNQLDPKWSAKDDMSTIEKVENSKFIITQKQAKYSYKAVEVALEDERDYSVETVVSHLSGTGQGAFGLVFASDGENDNYVFTITASGDYALGYRNQGHFKAFVAPTESKFIKKGNNASNKLRLETAGNKLKLFINDKLVNTVNMIQPYGNDVGFIVEKQQSVAFNYLAVSYLQDSRDGTDQPANTNVAAAVNLPPNQVAAVSHPVAAVNSLPVGGKPANANNAVSEVVKDSVKHNVSPSVKEAEITPVKDTAVHAVNRPANIKAQLAADTSHSAFKLVTLPAKDTIKHAANSVNNVPLPETAHVIANVNGIAKDTTRRPVNSLVNLQPKDTGRIVNKAINLPVSDTGKQLVVQRTNVVTNVPARDTAKQVVIQPLSATILEMAYHTGFSADEQATWDVNQSDSLQTSFGSGRLKIERTAKLWFADALKPSKIALDMHRDFLIETRATHLSGAKNFGYGLEFGADSSRKYHFWITASGFYNICYTSDNGFKTTISYSVSDFINKGDSVKNKLGVEHKNGQFYFFINDRRVDKFAETGTFGQQAGLSVNGNQTVGFDYFTFGYLDKALPPVKADSAVVPKIIITAPELTRGLKIVTSNTLHVAGIAKDPTGISAVKVNDVPASVDMNGNFMADIPMAGGNNFVKVIAFNNDGRQGTYNFNIEHNGLSTTQQADLKQASSEGKYYALLIGEQDYSDSRIPSLEGPISDAAALKDALIENYTFRRENVTIKENPTRGDLFSALDDLRDKAGSDDNVLIFYAGHGLYDDNQLQGYWFPSDAQKDKRYTWVSNAEILGYITAIKAKHTLLISDACFSGSIFKSRGVELAPKDIQELYRFPSRKAMTSGTMNEVPDKSVFIEYMVKRLKENTDPFLPAEQLFARFKSAVISNSKTSQIPQFGEIRGAGDEGGDFIFVKKN